MHSSCRRPADNNLTVSNAETITGGGLNDTITLGAAQASGTVNLGVGADSLTLSSAGNNTLTVLNARDNLGRRRQRYDHARHALTRQQPRPRRRQRQPSRLANGANTVTVSNAETINGNAGADTVTLGTAQASGTINLATGADSLTPPRPATTRDRLRHGDDHRRHAE